ncbi:interferon-induced transmembrane protein 3-like [Dromiciops gliroides]|uniref:interferon-induced transmembrane protein 3-like n=1 Tax=Dromiciops gliroides TaxID=33562 RepID=UPI001CC722B0|nr:interferon-induced transmembrane protein 3-like [Dromiciops gliroides]
MPDHTVIAMQVGGPEKGLTPDPPRDYLLLSLFNMLLLGNPCCLSFVALVYSVKSRDRKLVGDMNGASSYGNTSKQMNICAMILNVVILIISIVLIYIYLYPLILRLYHQ